MFWFFSYLGYKTIQIVVANQATVKLTEDATTLKNRNKCRILFY
jgi:hypothetical protein